MVPFLSLGIETNGLGVISRMWAVHVDQLISIFQPQTHPSPVQHGVTSRSATVAQSFVLKFGGTVSTSVHILTTSSRLHLVLSGGSSLRANHAAINETKSTVRGSSRSTQVLKHITNNSSSSPYSPIILVGRLRHPFQGASSHKACQHICRLLPSQLLRLLFPLYS